MISLPPYDGVIVGPTSHPIVPMLADELVSRGLRIAAVNGGGSIDRELVPGVPLLACEPRISEEVVQRANRRARWADRLERRAVMPLSRRSLSRFESEFGVRSAASIVKPIRRGEAAAAVVNDLQPRFVFVNHMFQFGWAAAQIHGPAKIVMPWGGDIYDFGLATPAARWLVGKAVRSGDAVVPSAISATEILTTTYGVSSDRIHPVSWGVDLKDLAARSQPEVQRRRSALELPADSRVVFNSRRLKSAWGGDEALEAMCAIARLVPDTYHVIIAGADNTESALTAERRVSDLGLGDQFRILTGDVAMSTYLDYCVAADVGLSLRGSRDMRSLSILQCAAAGLEMVCSDQPEYREMEKQGFVARFVDPDDSSALSAALLAALSVGPEERNRREVANRQFIEEHEDRLIQLDELVAVIETAGR